ncbi:DnaD domain-containing protein [Mesomycoplasma ovipneumoniae]
MHSCYVISNSDIDQNDLNNLLYFYFPVVKFQGYLLFQYFLTIKNANEPINFDFLDKIYSISLDNFNKTREILECLNLIQTFYDSQKEKYFIEIKKPLNSEQIDKNPYLKPLITEKITDKRYLSLISKFKNNFEKFDSRQIETDNFHNLSKKFYEIFGQNNQNISTIFNCVKNSDNNEAKKELNFEKYHLFLTGYSMKPRLRNSLLKYVEERSFSNWAINNVIEYCFKVGNQVKFNYIKKILDSLWDDQIISGADVELELEEIFRTKIKNKNKSESAKTKKIIDPESSAKKIAKAKSPKKSKVETPEMINAISWFIDENEIN